jgi:hypothetical protein
MQFRVVIPEQVKAGQTIRIHCPDGTEANVKVPKGLKTGDSFIFEMSVDQLNNPQALLDSLNSKSKESAKSPNKSTIKLDTIAAPKKKGFLDREIVNLQDFALALSVGLIIGLGIVLGFLLGILSVTEHHVPTEPAGAPDTLEPPGQEQFFPQSNSNRVLGGTSSGIKIKASSQKMEL